jgi:hypothetical protein
MPHIDPAPRLACSMRANSPELNNFMAGPVSNKPRDIFKD